MRINEWGWYKSESKTQELKREYFSCKMQREKEKEQQNLKEGNGNERKPKTMKGNEFLKT
jgi:hypothetical protein